MADVRVAAPHPLRVTAQLRVAARSAPGGWLIAVDPYFDPAGDVPPLGLLGAWRIDDAGEVTGEYRANPEYRPSPLARGWPEPGDDLDRVAQLAAAGHATLDDVAVAMLFDEVFYALDEAGVPVLEGEGRICVYSASSRRPEVLASGAVWHGSTGRELAVRNVASAPVVLNPGSWEAVLPGVELAARAAGEASGYLLAECIEDFLAGARDGVELHAVFCDAQVFCQAGERPGFLAIGSGKGRAVPVFTSMVELARFAGQTSWFSALGQDMLDMLPDGYDVVVDPGTARAVRLRGDATVRVDAGKSNGAARGD